jgi:hypothetical protein
MSFSKCKYKLNEIFYISWFMFFTGGFLITGVSLLFSKNNYSADIAIISGIIGMVFLLLWIKFSDDGRFEND